MIRRSSGVSFPGLSKTASGVATLPISFGGWGVREAALIGLLAPFGIAAESALGISVALGLLVMAAGLPGGVLWLMPRMRRRPERRLFREHI